MENHEPKYVWLPTIGIGKRYKVISVVKSKHNKWMWIELAEFKKKIHVSACAFSEEEAYEKALHNLKIEINDNYNYDKKLQGENLIDERITIAIRVVIDWECSSGHHHKTKKAAQKCEEKKLEKQQ